MVDKTSANDEFVLSHFQNCKRDDRVSIKCCRSAVKVTAVGHHHIVRKIRWRHFAVHHSLGWGPVGRYSSLAIGKSRNYEQLPGGVLPFDEVMVPS